MRARAAAFVGSANWVKALMACLALWYGFLIIFMAIYTFWAATPRVATNPEVINAFFMGSTPSAVAWNLATFGLYIAILAALLRAFHNRTLLILIGPPRPALRQFRRVFLYLLPLFLFLFLPSLTHPDVYHNLSFGRWLSLLPLMLPLLFVQISAEELIFRGYLQSHLAALSQNPFIWMGIPSFLFGLIHYDSIQPAYSAWAYVVWATGLGLVAADLTARSGTLGPALALHFVNNIFALLFVAADDWLFGASLFIWQTYGMPWEPWIPFEALTLFTFWLAARLALRR